MDFKELLNEYKALKYKIFKYFNIKYDSEYFDTLILDLTECFWSVNEEKNLYIYYINKIYIPYPLDKDNSWLYNQLQRGENYTCIIFKNDYFDHLQIFDNSKEITRESAS